jgi:hypothetical protein
MHNEPSAKSGDLTRFDRIVLHLRCLSRDHNYRWHWAGFGASSIEFIDAPHQLNAFDSHFLKWRSSKA